ncbi:MAG: hypothetical protein BJ554DRAFT_4317 [Olpidium bornovanus]|uniref:Uncharacterized protein n=1 Tax=Olpidium bornovanus TaxID=278681 RepID=A0A8H8DFK3_9FUNG|nr:MAG: hypothetical protein BJ554DRAFT_4317 [Olpidium bornovanus]
MAAESGSSPDRPAPDPDAEEDDNGGGGGVEDRASSPETAPDHRRRPESDRSPSDRRAGDADDPTAFGFLPPPLPREEEKEEGEEDNDFTGDDNGGDPVLLPGAGPARAQDDAAAAAAAGAEFTLRGRRRTLPSTVMTRASPVAAKAHPSSSSSSAGLSSGRSDVLRGATTAASPPALPLPPSPSPPHPQDDPRWSTPSSFLSAVEPAAAAATATATPASRNRQRQETDHSNHVSPQLLPIDLDEVVDDDDQFWNYFASYNAFDLSGSPLVDRAIDKVRQVRQEVERTLLSRAAGRRGVNKVEIEARLRKRFAALKRQVDTSTRVISEKLAEAPMIRLRDRVSFLLGVTGMWCSAMVMVSTLFACARVWVWV